MFIVLVLFFIFRFLFIMNNHKKKIIYNNRSTLNMIEPILKDIFEVPLVDINNFNYEEHYFIVAWFYNVLQSKKKKKNFRFKKYKSI